MINSNYLPNYEIRKNNLLKLIQKYKLITLNYNYYFDPKNNYLWCVFYQNDPYIIFTKPDYYIYNYILLSNNIFINNYYNQPNNLC